MATSVELDFLEKQFPATLSGIVTTYDSRQRRVVQLERIQFRGMTLSQVSAPVSNLKRRRVFTGCTDPFGAFDTEKLGCCG